MNNFQKGASIGLSIGVIANALLWAYYRGRIKAKEEDADTLKNFVDMLINDTKECED